MGTCPSCHGVAIMPKQPNNHTPPCRCNQITNYCPVVTHPRPIKTTFYLSPPYSNDTVPASHLYRLTSQRKPRMKSENLQKPDFQTCTNPNSQATFLTLRPVHRFRAVTILFNDDLLPKQSPSNSITLKIFAQYKPFTNVSHHQLRGQQ